MTGKENDLAASNTTRFYYGYVIVLAAFIVIVCSYIIRYSFGVFFKPIVIEFGWTRAITSGAYTLSWFFEGLLGIAFGGLTDRFGPRAVLSFCGFFMGLGCVLLSQLSATWQLYVFYGIIFGIGISGVWVPLVSTVARWFKSRRGMMTGIVLSGMGISALIGAPLANWLISSYGWRDSFIIVGGLVGCIIILASQFLKRAPLSIEQEANKHVNNNADLNSTVVEFSLRKAMSTRQFWLIFTMFFCFGFGSFSIILHIVPHATDIGISAASAANILAALGGAMILGRIILGSIADKIGARQIFIIGLVIFSVTLILLLYTRELWLFYILCALQGFGHGGMGASESLLIAEIFGLRSLGIIMGVAGFGFTIGAGVGPLVTGHIFDISSSYDIAFILNAALCAIGLILTLLIRTKNYR